MRKHALIGLLAVSLALAGCVSSGKEISDSQLNQFVRGRTTEADVVAVLGQPNFTDRSATGQFTDTYEYMKAGPEAQTYIPIVGAFIASSDMKTQAVRFVFSAKGVLLDWSISTSNQHLNNGYFNQH
jgi:hypothetical protein